MLKTIDLNADVGESLYQHRIGEDDTLIPLLSSANIACGFHGGDPTTIGRAIDLAVQHGVRIGAHPGYDDRTGAPAFGREERGLAPAVIADQLEYQLAALYGLTAVRGAQITHVKLHGALYHRVSADALAAHAALGAIRKVLPHATITAQAGSPFAALASGAGFRVLAEAFADRLYLADGKLAPRGQAGAVISNPDMIAAQALAIARDGEVATANGGRLKISADTLCLHGDHPGATEAARAIRALFAKSGIGIA